MTRVASLDKRLVFLTTLVATIAALLIATLPPLSYFYFGYRYCAGYITAEALAQRTIVESLINRHPRLWWFASEKIDDALLKTESFGDEEIEGEDEALDRRRIFRTDGDLVSDFLDVEGVVPPLPVVRESTDLRYNGDVVGRLEIERSLLPLLYRSAWIGLFSSFIGALIFLGMRTLPLRALRRTVERTSFLASHDPLTGLPNRQLFRDLLERALARSRRRGESSFAVLCLDLDHFKDVNDTLGHAAGDRLLEQVVYRLGLCVRESDALARLGGDEFAILQSSVNDPDAARVLAQRIIDQLSQPFELDSNEVLIGVSIGVTLYTDPAQTPCTLLRDADLSLYRAKAAGRGTFCFFAEEMNIQLETRKRLERELRQAIAEEHFELFYQPQFDVDRGVFTGVEALLRWRHPERGVILPSEFIPLAEETGLIFPLGEWVLRTACRQASHWPDLNVAVNLSPVQFRQPALDQLIRRILEESKLDPRRLEVEVTEGILLNDTENTLATLESIKALGVSVAMDDFGTGYSSLSYLRRFPFNKVKIDRMFIKDISDTGESIAIVRAVVRLAHALGMTATAEGVEDRPQLEILRAEGCDEVQGFHVGKPMPAKAIDDLLAIASKAAPLHLHRRIG